MDGQDHLQDQHQDQHRAGAHENQNTSGTGGNVGGVFLAGATNQPVSGTASDSESNFDHNLVRVVDYVIGSGVDVSAGSAVGSAGDRDPTHDVDGPGGDGLTAKGDGAMAAAHTLLRVASSSPQQQDRSVGTNPSESQDIPSAEHPEATIVQGVKAVQARSEDEVLVDYGEDSPRPLFDEPSDLTSSIDITTLDKDKEPQNQDKTDAEAVSTSKDDDEETKDRAKTDAEVVSTQLTSKDDDEEAKDQEHDLNKDQEPQNRAKTDTEVVTLQMTSKDADEEAKDEGQQHKVLDPDKTRKVVAKRSSDDSKESKSDQFVTTQGEENARSVGDDDDATAEETKSVEDVALRIAREQEEAASAAQRAKSIQIETEEEAAKRIAEKKAADIRLAKAKAEQEEHRQDWQETSEWAEYLINAAVDDTQLSGINVEMLYRWFALPPDTLITIAGQPSVYLHQLSLFREREWISDLCIEAALQVCRYETPREFVLIDSITTQNVDSPYCSPMSQESFDRQILEGRKVGLLVIFMNAGTNHWVVIILNFEENKRVLFDSLQERAYYRLMNNFCYKHIRPLIRDIYADLKETQYDDYEQKDKVSCGLYTTEFIDKYINKKEFRMEEDNEAEQDRTQFLRLYYLNMVLSCSVQVKPVPKTKLLTEKGDENNPSLVESVGKGISECEAEGETVLSATKGISECEAEGETVLSATKGKSDDGETQSQQISSQVPVEHSDSTGSKRKRRGRGSLKKRKKGPANDDKNSSDEGVITPRKAGRIVNSPSPQSSPVEQASLSKSNDSPQASPLSKPSLDHERVSNPPISPLTKASTQEDDESSASSVPSSPATVSTIRPIPRRHGKVMSMESMRNEMVDYIYRHRRPGVTLPVLLALFVEHLTADNRAQFLELFEDLTEKIGDHYVLSSPYFPTGRITRKRKSDSTDDKFAKQSRTDSFTFELQDDDSSSSSSSSSYAAIESSSSSDETDTDEEAASRPDATDTDKASRPLVNATTSTDQAKDVSEPVKASTPRADTATSTPSQLTPRQLLREELIDILQSDRGLFTAGIHLRVQNKTSLLRPVIDEVLHQVGEQRNRRWYLKNNVRLMVSSASRAQADKVNAAPSRPAPPVQDLIVNVKDSKRLGKRQSYNMDIWTVKRKRLVQPSVASIEANFIPPDHDVVDRIIDIDEDDNGRPLYLARYEKDENDVRPPNRWLRPDEFWDIGEFERNIDIVLRWKRSGLPKNKFYQDDEAARDVLDFSRRAGADGDQGWCSFRAVGVAIELLMGKQIVTPEYITAFQERGLKRHPTRSEVKYGTRWPEVYAFIRDVCSRKVGYNIPYDQEELLKNRAGKHCGSGIDALRRCNLEPGIYLVAGLNEYKTMGHCVVLEVQDDRVLVWEEDVVSGLEALDWLHQLSYVRRFKLMKSFPNIPSLVEK
jgi:hypothetical protein